jgi:hypothetical protein
MERKYAEMKKNRGSQHLKILQLAGLMLIAGQIGVSSAQAQTLSGRAYSAFIHVPSQGVGPIYIVDSGALPAGGGWNGDGSTTVSIAGVLSANVPVAATVGIPSLTKANSSTSAADVVVLPASLAELRVSFVRAQTEVTASGVQGSTEINKLTLAGVPITVTGQPNQIVHIPFVATLIINERAATASSITVNALHLVLAGGGEVILSSASSQITF